MSFKIVSSPLDIEIEGDDGAVWGIDVLPSGSLKLYGTSAAYRDRDNRDAWDEGRVDIAPEQAGDVMAALTAWFDQLPVKSPT